MSLVALLAQTAVVHRRSATTYVDGTPIRGNYAPVGSYPGRIGRQSGGEGLTANSDQREAVRTGVVYLPAGADVLVSDVLEIEGRLFEVTFTRVSRGYSAQPHHVEADVRLIIST